MDRLTNLPDFVIECIIGKLPLADQVRTSVLSSCWKHKWVKLPSIVIDEKFYELFWTSRFNLRVRRRNILHPECLTVINRILMQHIGHLREFSLTIPSEAQELKAGFHLPLQFVLRNGVERLSVNNMLSGSQPCLLPLFSGLGLKHLILENCELCFPPAFDFPNLISFTQNGFSDRLDTVFFLISSCPVIEEVVLGFDSCDEVLNFQAPRLHSLYLNGRFKSISLHDAQTVETLELSYCDEGNVSSEDMNYLSYMNNLKDLALGESTYKIISRCTHLPRLDKLKQLTLYDMCFHDIDYLHCLLSFSTRASNLKELNIWGSIKADDKDEYQSLVKNYSNHIFDNLHTVYIEVIDGSKTEISFIELLLCGSPLLETMSIKCTSSIDASEELRIAKLVLAFCRASPKSKVMILK